VNVVGRPTAAVAGASNRTVGGRFRTLSVRHVVEVWSASGSRSSLSVAVRQSVWVPGLSRLAGMVDEEAVEVQVVDAPSCSVHDKDCTARSPACVFDDTARLVSEGKLRLVAGGARLAAAVPGLASMTAVGGRLP
jgi:hypothetical protein